KAQIGESKGEFEQAQKALIVALKIVPENNDLQAKLASIQKQLQLADDKKAADAKAAAERAAAGRRASELAQLTSACRSALDRKDHSVANDQCNSLKSKFPEESATKTLWTRVQLEIPRRVTTGATTHNTNSQATTQSSGRPGRATIGN